jgi:small-conductance mechanosensitive channel
MQHMDQGGNSMKFWDRVKKDLQVAMKEGAELFKEGTTVLSTEARRMTKKGAATMTADAQKMMKEGVATARKGAATVTAEAQRMAKIANLRYQLFQMNRKAQDKFAELGGHIYDSAAKNPKSIRLDAKARKLILEAKQIEGQIKKLKSEIDRVSKD